MSKTPREPLTSIFFDRQVSLSFSVNLEKNPNSTNRALSGPVRLHNSTNVPSFFSKTLEFPNNNACLRFLSSSLLLHPAGRSRPRNRLFGLNQIKVTPSSPTPPSSPLLQRSTRPCLHTGRSPHRIRSYLRYRERRRGNDAENAHMRECLDRGSWCSRLSDLEISDDIWNIEREGFDGKWKL